MSVFGMNSAFNRFGTKVFDMMIILLLWITTSVLGLGITFGASITASFYVIDKTIINNRGYVIKNFFKSFKLNFKKATLLWLLIEIMFLIMGIIFIEFKQVEEIPVVVVAMSYFVFFELSLLIIYSFVILAKLEINIKELILKSLLLAHKHLLTTLTSLSIIIVFALLTIKVNVLFIFVGLGIWSYINSKLIVGNLLVKYIDQEKLVEFENVI